MICPTCGRELGNDQHCSSCQALAPSSAPSTTASPTTQQPPHGDAFFAAKSPTLWGRLKPPILIVAGILLWVSILRLNYLKALRWAGTMTAEAAGYMMGGCLFPLLVALIVMFLVAKIRGRKSAPPTRFFGVSAVAFLLSLLSFVGSLSAPPNNVQQSVGDLMRQAAGNKPLGADAHWSDAPMRDFFREAFDRNQQYAAEIKALDNSAIKNLYSPDSYAGATHMEKVLSQLHALYDVETKYASLDPLIKDLKDRVAAAHASEDQKREFLIGMQQGLDRSMKPRTDSLHAEKLWMDSTLALYEFMVAHSSDYSIRNTKLYFSDPKIGKQFTALQSTAVASHKDFLKAKATFEESRKNNMNQLGLSPSEFTPSQLGKTH